MGLEFVLSPWRLTVLLLWLRGPHTCLFWRPLPLAGVPPPARGARRRLGATEDTASHPLAINEHRIYSQRPWSACLPCFAWGVALDLGTMQGRQRIDHPRGPSSFYNYEEFTRLAETRLAQNSFNVLNIT